MALRPIKGRPGKFLETGTGQVIDISDYREDDKYDTVALPTGAVTAGQELILFRDVANKRDIDTNFSQQSRLSAGEEMIIDRVGLTAPSDIKKLAECAFYRVEVNRLLLIEGPAIKFPSGYGLYGNTVENNQGIVSIGVPATASAAKLIKTQLITASHEVQGFLRFLDRNWAATEVPVVADRLPVFATPLFVTGWLHGLIKTASTK
jgi:hypothetical protein